MHEVIHFYDNDLKNSNNSHLCPFILFKWVNASGNVTGRNAQTEDWDEYRKYDKQCVQLFEEGSKARKLADFIGDKHHYDIYAGHEVIENGKRQCFFGHVMRAAVSRRVVGFVFDWDRTLQVMEGIIPYSLQTWKQQANFSNIEDTVEALSEYHAGGKMRLAKLRVMFAAIGKKPVTIVSANVAIEQIPTVYMAILENWGCENITGLHHSTEKYALMCSLF